MHRGYIKFWRKTEDSVSWTRGLEHRGMIITILDRAAWKPRFEWGIQVQPGEFLVKVVAWAETLGMPQTSVRRILQNLVADGFIAMSNAANRYTKIKVLNWHIYQQDEKAPWRADGEQTANPRLTGGEQAANPLYKEEEGKKEKKEDKNPPYPPLAGGVGSDENASRPTGKEKKAGDPAGDSKPELRAAIAAYTDSEPLRQALEDFRLMRERISKPMTGRALRNILISLDRMAANEAEKIAIVDQSITNSWRDVFPLKDKQARASPFGKPTLNEIVDYNAAVTRQMLLQENVHGSGNNAKSCKAVGA